MRVCLVALSVRGAMGQYVTELVDALASNSRLHLELWVPSHFDDTQLCAKIPIKHFNTGKARLIALARLANPVLAVQIWNAIQQSRPVLIHLFNGEGYPWSLIWAYMSTHRGIPLLVTVHDPEPHPGNLWELLNARLRSYVLRRAKSVHVHHRSFVRLVCNQGARAVYVIPHGSLAPRFIRYKRPGVQRERIALFFGRIEPYKGLDVLIEAGLILKGKLRIVIAGPGKLPKKLSRVISRHRDIFEIHNRYLSDPEVAHLFQRASVCVLPYRQASQSAVPLIAAGFEVPVVATAVGAFLEDIPRVNGLLVPPDDPRALAEAMLEAVGMVPAYPADLEFPVLCRQFIKWYEHQANA